MRLLTGSGLLLFVVSSIAALDCGHLGSGFAHSRSKRAIIGGREIQAEDVPWIARVDGPGQKDKVQLKHLVEGGSCSGALITDRHVITAAHCFAGWKDGEGCVMREHPVNSICYQENLIHEKCSEERTIPIKRLHLVEDFMSSNCSSYFDIAVVELERPVPFAPKICLPLPPREFNYEKTNESEVHILGYSPNYQWKIANNHLKYGTTKVTLMEEALISHHDPQTGGICGGDSGGPMFEIHDDKAFLIGVNIAGPSCKHEDTTDEWREGSLQRALEVKQHLGKIINVVMGM